MHADGIDSHLSPEQLRRVEELVLRAASLASSESQAMLEAGVDDPDVRREVVRRLNSRSNRPDSTLLKSPAHASPRSHTPQSPVAPADAPQIEGYYGLTEYGHGGQGIVYRGLQKETKREVAIKVLRDGTYASHSARQRFEREIEVVAHLNHPNIVAVHHCGRTADNHQFAAMDFVDGLPLTAYVRTNQLALEPVLRLFARVCAAVQYAHQRGIIHRDLKPSNILVTPDGEPRVLDFGMAKRSAAADDTALTLSDQVLGTLPYMSPEQARGAAHEVDVRADVYSLGVILYELLTGAYPYAVSGSITFVLRQIVDASPTPPVRAWNPESGVSRRVSRWGSRGGCPIDDELATIVLRALAKDRDRRYQSAADLARDVEHYLLHEPIEAKRDSHWYVLRKSIRRHPGRFLAAAAFVLLLLGATAVSTTLWRRAVAAEHRQASERQQAVLTAMTLKKTLEGATPAQARGRDVSVLLDMLRSAARDISSGALASAPESELDLRLTIGRTFWRLGAYPEAASMLHPVVDLARTLYAPDHFQVGAALDERGLLRLQEGDAANALPDFEAALGIIERTGPDIDKVKCLNNLGNCLRTLGRTDDALRRHESARALIEGLQPLDLEQLAVTDNLIGGCYVARRQYRKAVPPLRAALKTRRRLFQTDHPDLAESLNNVAACEQLMGHPDEALPALEEALAMRRRLFRGDHPDLYRNMATLGDCLTALSRVSEALPIYRESLAMRLRLFPKGNTAVVDGHRFVAACLEQLGRHADALAQYRAAADLRRKLSDDEADLAYLLTKLGVCLINLARFEDALAPLREAREIASRSLNANHPDRVYAQICFANALVGLTKFAEAEPIAVKAAERVLANEDSLGDLLQPAVQVVVHLYEQWDSADPGKGLAADVAQWRRVAATRGLTLASRGPSTQPHSATASTSSAP